MGDNVAAMISESQTFVNRTQSNKFGRGLGLPKPFHFGASLGRPWVSPRWFH
jgi:hypothetical protein